MTDKVIKMPKGTNIKALRDMYSLTQSRLAEMLDVTPETVTRWETGKMDIRQRHVDRICELFDLKADDINSSTMGLAKKAYRPETENLDTSLLAQNIKLLRLEKDMTQGKLAELVGVSRGAVAQWELGISRPRASVLEKVADALNVDVEHLLNTHEPEEYTEGENLSAFRHKYRLSADRLAEILGITPQTLSDLEANKVGITQDQLHTLCDTFNIPYADIKSTTQGLAAKMKTELPLPTNALIPTSRVMVKVPLLGRIFAGNLNHAIEVPDEWANVPEEVSDKYPDSFCLTVRGDSMNKVIANGAFVLIDTTQTTPQNTYIYAVIVNGDEATIKHVRQLNNGLELIPNSTDPTFKTVVYDFSEPDCPEIQILGRAVWIGLPDDFLIRNGRL